MRRSRPPNLPPAGIARWPCPVRHWHAAVAIASPAHSSSETRDQRWKKDGGANHTLSPLPAPALLGPGLASVCEQGETLERAWNSSSPANQLAAAPVTWIAFVQPAGALSHGLAPSPLHTRSGNITSDSSSRQAPKPGCGTLDGTKNCWAIKAISANRPFCSCSNVALVALCSCILSSVLYCTVL